MNALELRGVTKRYPGFTLQDITFSLPAGCILGLVGENGAGKSTIIHLILDAMRPDEGEISVLGHSNRSDLRSVKEELGVVLDEASFPESFALPQIDAVLRRIYRQWDSQRFFDLARRFSLPRDRAFQDFSRGMKMKLAIAAALSHHARLLLLDEATSGLDPMVRDEILDILLDFAREGDNAILISSHIVSDLEKLCDYIAFVHGGRLLLCEEKDRLLEQYGLLTCSKADLAALPDGAAFVKRESAYGVEALVQKEKAPRGLELHPAALEDIIVTLAKGGAMQ